jgi:hypothetical protein
VGFEPEEEGTSILVVVVDGKEEADFEVNLSPGSNTSARLMELHLVSDMGTRPCRLVVKRQPELESMGSSSFTMTSFLEHQVA